MTTASSPLTVAVIGSGVAGLAASWLLKRRHDVTLYERAARLGGHCNTVDVSDANGNPVAIDTGFIVYNSVNYPNLVALFQALGVATHASDMSFAVSLDGGRLEYSGSDLGGLFAQRRNLVSPRFWRMLGDIARFYRAAPRLLAAADADTLTLGAYLDAENYSAAFVDEHILPMAAAIWSSAKADMRHYPARDFVRFCANHGLLRLTRRPQWRTVIGGSRVYVAKMSATLADGVALGTAVRSVRRRHDGVTVEDDKGGVRRFDQVVIAAHADEALAMLADADPEERRLLGAFRYARKRAVLHSDASFMPVRRRAWASWNYLGRSGADGELPTVTYWMNNLQKLTCQREFFVTLNPPREPRAAHAEFVYDHPGFDPRAGAAQRELWSLQGRRRTWFCGAHFGAGFHEDGLQAGLAVAEDLGGVRRPWSVAEESGRIWRTAAPVLSEAAE
ncbi:MAG TPA: FAD-dependent oxidoreductase [Stellaceae bacterium]|nr:FAD-dependent oxidoreductase [Stellaceae bacterium]